MTGTVSSGRVAVGDELTLLPGGETVRVRGVQVHGEAVEESSAGLRTALNLAGGGKQEPARGAVVGTPGALFESSIVDVRYRHLPGAPDLARMSRVRLLIGTSEVLAVVELLDGDGDPATDGEERWLQLRCEAPVVAWPGDRFVLRRATPLTTLGGGEVVDPFAPRVRRRDVGAAVELLERMSAGDEIARLDRAGAVGLTETEAAARGLSEEYEGVVRLGERLLSTAQLEVLRERLLKALTEAHDSAPLSRWVGRRVIFQGLFEALGVAAFNDLLTLLVDEGKIVAEGPGVALRGWSVELSQAQRDALTQLLEVLQVSGLEPPSLKELPRHKALDNDLIAHAVEEGLVVRIGATLYLRAHLEAVKGQVISLLSREGELTPGAFKGLTGLSRKGAIPMLEWLDREGVTKRRGDVRVRA